MPAARAERPEEPHSLLGARHSVALFVVYTGTLRHGVARSQLTTSGHLAFVQARHQLGEIAGPEADVELLAQDVVPAVLAGAGRARQREDVGGIGDTRGGSTLHGRGADLLEADPAKGLAEALDLFLEQALQRLGCD